MSYRPSVPRLELNTPTPTTYDRDNDSDDTGSDDDDDANEDTENGEAVLEIKLVEFELQKRAPNIEYRLLTVRFLVTY